MIASTSYYVNGKCTCGATGCPDACSLVVYIVGNDSFDIHECAKEIIDNSYSYYVELKEHEIKERVHIHPQLDKSYRKFHTYQYWPRPIKTRKIMFCKSGYLPSRIRSKKFN